MHAGGVQHQRDGVGRGIALPRPCEHADVVGVVAHAEHVLPLHVQQLRQTLHHAALVGALGRQLHQRHGAGHHLIVVVPRLGAQIVQQVVQVLLLRGKQRLADGGRHRVHGVHLDGRRVGDVHVPPGHVVGVQGVDGVVIVIQLHRHPGHGRHHLGNVRPDGVRQKGRHQIFLPGEIVDGCTVEQHGGRIHGNAVHHRFKGGLGTAGSHGEQAAVGHEILQRGAVFVRYRGHVHAFLQRLLGVDQCIVKVADQQQTVKFSHDCLRLRSAVGLASAAASAAGTAPVVVPLLLAGRCFSGGTLLLLGRGLRCGRRSLSAAAAPASASSAAAAALPVRLVAGGIVRLFAAGGLVVRGGLLRRALSGALSAAASASAPAAAALAVLGGGCVRVKVADQRDGG